MPDPNCSSQTDRAWEIQKIDWSRNGYKGGDMKKERLNSKKLELNALQGRGHVYRTMSLKGQSAPKKARGKESSKHFGVRFRPDLHKWVAEIRVAEWKSVDKKVWLGTFDTEVGAARAVDAARKLLKCKKKRQPNFPCLNLDAYAETIPSQLNLNNLENEAMFKEVTSFIKHKVQEYAASFGRSTLSDCVSVVTAHPSSCYSQPSTSLDMQQQQHEFSFHSQPSFGSSCEDHDSNFPCQGLPAVSSSLSSSSNSEEEELVYAHSSSFDTIGLFRAYVDDLIDDQSMVEYETTMSWEETTLFSFDDIRDDELVLDNVLAEYRIPSDDQAYNCAQELMDISYEEVQMPSNNCSTKPDYMSEFQRTASSTVEISVLQQPLHPFNNSFFKRQIDCQQVY